MRGERFVIILRKGGGPTRTRKSLIAAMAACPCAKQEGGRHRGMRRHRAGDADGEGYGRGRHDIEYLPFTHLLACNIKSVHATQQQQRASLSIGSSWRAVRWYSPTKTSPTAKNRSNPAPRGPAGQNESNRCTYRHLLICNVIK